MNKTVMLIGVWIFLIVSGCVEKQHTTSTQLKDLVDHNVWQLCDSINKNRTKIIRSDGYTVIDSLKHILSTSNFEKREATSAMLVANIGSLYANVAQADSAILYTERALPYFEKHPDFITYLVRCYSTLGLSLNNQRKNIFKANYYSTKAASICSLPGNDTSFSKDFISQVYYTAAITNALCGQKSVALQFARLGYDLADKQKDSSASRYVRAATILPTVYISNKKYDSAYLYIQTADKWNEQAKHPILTNAINSLKCEYYFAVKQYDSSLKYAQIVDWSNDPFTGAYTKLLLYTELKTPREAMFNLHLADSLLHGARDENDNGVASFYLAKTAYQIQYGNRDSASKAIMVYDSVVTDFYDRERFKMLASIESEYSLADKQKRIDRLGDLNKEAQSVIKQKNNLLIISVLSILLLITGIVVLFLVMQRRRLLAANRAILAERDKLILEERLLRTQMEPHFIFNTLNVMKGLVRNRETDKAMLYMDKFARLLRTSLENSREDYVLVSEEIEALQDYMSLQAIRFEDAFDYTIRVYHGYEEDDIKIPPMLLQPFVENAIYHGMKGISHKGIINIIIEKKEHYLYCSVEDNGPGIPLQQSTPDKKSLAMRIARERLDIVQRETGYKAFIDIHAMPEGKSGTLVVLQIPFV